MKPRLALRMEIRPFMKSRLAIRLMKYESTLLNQYPHKHLPNQSPPHPHNFRPTLTTLCLKTHAILCFFSSGNLVSGSLQSQQELLKNTVEQKCETFWSTLNASFLALKVLLKI